VCETVEKYGANQEECARLNASLSCLRNVHMSGEQVQGCEALSPAHRPPFLKIPVQTRMRQSPLWIANKGRGERGEGWRPEDRAACWGHND
jgi:hypothetical protein